VAGGGRRATGAAAGAQPGLPQRPGGAGARASASTTISTLPSPTRSPRATFTSLTTPAAGDGTSIVALSDSSVAMASSTLMLSPTLTNSSMTGTSAKSPMSGLD
jgi:hypothetical protein